MVMIVFTFFFARANEFVIVRYCVWAQAFVRGYLHRKRVARRQQAAVTLQAALRAMAVRKRYLLQRQAVITLQRRLRANRSVNRRDAVCYFK